MSMMENRADPSEGVWSQRVSHSTVGAADAQQRVPWVMSTEPAHVPCVSAGAGSRVPQDDGRPTTDGSRAA